jgi:hypothetical protein
LCIQDHVGACRRLIVVLGPVLFSFPYIQQYRRFNNKKWYKAVSVTSFTFFDLLFINRFYNTNFILFYFIFLSRHEEILVNLKQVLKASDPQEARMT